jgi:hypothetical protein
MLLRNIDRYLDGWHIDVLRDVRERHKLSNDDCCDGSFFEHNGSLFGLGTDSGELYVIAGGRLLKFNDQKLRTELRVSLDGNVFTLIADSLPILEVSYKPMKASGWIPNEDDECLDGFLWMHNVLQNPERRATIIANHRNE